MLTRTDLSQVQKIVKDETQKTFREETPKIVHDEALKIVREETPKIVHEEALRVVREETPKIVHDEALKIVREETPKIIQAETAPIKKDLKTVKSAVTRTRRDITAILNLFDREYLDLRKKVKRIEEHLNLSPAQ